MTVNPARFCSLIACFLAGAACVLASAPALRAADAPPNGEQLYRRHCARCHGASGMGGGRDAAVFATPPRNLREGFLKKYSTPDLADRILVGRELQLALDLPALKARAGEVESLVAHMKRLPEINWRRVEPGWELYVDRCESCHGPYGRPPTALPAGVRRPRDLSDPAMQGALSDAQLATAVRHGEAHMPALVPRLSEEDAVLVAAFVRLLSPGFELYSQYCASCHADDGRPVETLIDTLNTPEVIFDRAYFKRRSPEEIRAAVWHMLGTQKPAMTHFRATLSKAQAAAIVEYLKRTEPR
jgi:mono/diheme cytochrome c family protein